MMARSVCKCFAVKPLEGVDFAIVQTNMQERMRRACADHPASQPLLQWPRPVLRECNVSGTLKSSTDDMLLPVWSKLVDEFKR